MHIQARKLAAASAIARILRGALVRRRFRAIMSKVGIIAVLQARCRGFIVRQLLGSDMAKIRESVQQAQAMRIAMEAEEARVQKAQLEYERGMEMARQRAHEEKLRLERAEEEKQRSKYSKVLSQTALRGVNVRMEQSRKLNVQKHIDAATTIQRAWRKYYTFKTRLENVRIRAEQRRIASKAAKSG